MTDLNDSGGSRLPSPYQPPSPSYHAAPAPQTSGLAIASLILGIASFVLCGFLSAIPAVFCGHFSLTEIRRNPSLGGQGMAIAGLIMGYAAIALTVLAVIIVAAFMIFAVKFADETSTIDILPSPPEEAEFIVILPEGHPPSEPIPAAIWLHGYGSDTSELAYFEEEYQQIANDLGIAFIGISASSMMEEGSYQWLEDRDGDYAHLMAVLNNHAEAVTLDWPNVALFGFSQGAKVAGDLASQYPGQFRGAILMSPGGQKDEDVPTIETGGNAAQFYVCVVGADEAFGNVSLTRTYADKLRKLGAEVFLKEYEDIEDHTTPPDYYERLPEWLAKILDLKIAEALIQ